MMNAVSRQLYERSLGLLLLRVGVGLVFFMHGLSKVQGLSGVENFFSHGLGLPVWLAVFIAWLEVIGGLALILGIATRFFGLMFGIEMLVATFLVGFGRGLGLEFYLAAVSFSIALMGSGAFSVFKMECENCGGMVCDGETCVVEEIEA